jgi:hypothetical protein
MIFTGLFKRDRQRLVAGEISWAVAVLLCMVGTVFGMDTLRVFDEQDFLSTPLPLPAGIEVSLDATVEGNALKVFYTGNEPVSIPLFEVIRPEIEKEILVGKADLMARGMTSMACLEILCTLSGGRGPFFSRALDQAVTGDTGWTAGSVTFHFEDEQPPERVTVGLRMEGPGTVWINNIRLCFMTPMEAAGIHWSGLLAGPLIGLLGAVYGILAGILASRGRGKILLYTLHWLISGVAMGMLISGIIFWQRGVPWSGWYPWLLSGAIGLLVFLPLWPVLCRRYRRLENVACTRHD